MSASEGSESRRKLLGRIGRGVRICASHVIGTKSVSRGSDGRRGVYVLSCPAAVAGAMQRLNNLKIFDLYIYFYLF